MADAHEEDVRWQTGNHVDHHTFGLQVCEGNTFIIICSWLKIKDAKEAKKMNE